MCSVQRIVQVERIIKVSLYRYCTGNSKKEKNLKKRTCKIVGDKKGEWVQVQFLDTGKEETVERRKLRIVGLNIVCANNRSVNELRLR